MATQTQTQTQIATCTHTATTDLRTAGYIGSVAGPQGDENRAAHGGIAVNVECVCCGARRDENHNGLHLEVGAWGPSREARRQSAAGLRRAAATIRESTRNARATVRRGSEEVAVSVAPDGTIAIDGPHHERDIRAICAAVPGVVESAARLRAAVAAVESALLDV